MPLKKFESLRAGPGRPLTSKEIGRLFMKSVIVIQGDEISGTGFCVGSDGYLLTCMQAVCSAIGEDRCFVS